MQRCEFIGADTSVHDDLIVGIKVQTQTQRGMDVRICVFRGAGICSDPRLVHQSVLGSLSPVRSDGLPALHRRLVSWTQGLVRSAFSKHVGLDLGRQRIKDVLVNAEGGQVHLALLFAPRRKVHGQSRLPRRRGWRAG